MSEDFKNKPIENRKGGRTNPPYGEIPEVTPVAGSIKNGENRSGPKPVHQKGPKTTQK